MNHGWEKKRLGDVCSILNGFAFKSSEYVSSGIRIIRIANVQDGYISDELPQFYPDGLIPMFEKYLLHENDLLISLTGNVGRVALLPSSMLPAALNQRVACLRTHNVNKKYIYHFLQNIVFKQDCIAASTGIAQLNLSTEWLKEYRILIPPISYQDKIVEELDKINELIAVKRSQLKDLDALAQSLFYDIFGDPISNPMGWEIKKLEDVCEAISTGITYKPDMVTDKGTIVLRSSNIQNSEFVLDDIVRVTMKLKPSQLVQTNDILMCSRNGSARLVGKVALIPKLDEPMSWGAFMTIIRSNYYHYLFLYFRLPAFREQLTKTKTTTVNQITIGMLKNIKVPVPPLALQEQFAARIEEIEALKKQVEATIAEMQTLLASRMDYWFN